MFPVCGSQEAHLNLRVKASSTLNATLTECDGFIPQESRVLIDSTIAHWIGQYNDAPSNLLAHVDVKISFLQLLQACLSAPWFDGALTSLVDSIRSASALMSQDKNTQVSSEAKKCLQFVDAICASRVPPLTLVTRSTPAVNRIADNNDAPKIIHTMKEEAATAKQKKREQAEKKKENKRKKDAAEEDEKNAKKTKAPKEVEATSNDKSALPQSSKEAKIESEQEQDATKECPASTVEEKNTQEVQDAANQDTLAKEDPPKSQYTENSEVKETQNEIDDEDNKIDTEVAEEDASDSGDDFMPGIVDSRPDDDDE